AIAAVFFSRVYTGLGAGMIINEFIEDFMLSPSLVIVMMLVSFFVLGMFLDDFAITFITVPIYVPIVQSLGFRSEGTRLNSSHVFPTRRSSDLAIAAVFFSRVYTGLGAGMIINEFIEDFMLSPSLVIVMMLVSFFVLGMFLDDFAITFITVPIYVPIVQSLGFDTIWFAVLFILSMQTAYLTPPFGYNLFYMRSVAPREVSVT